MQTAIRRNTSYNIDKPVGAYITSTTMTFKTVKNMNTIENKFTACSRTKKSPTYLNTFLGGKPSNVYP